jgi:hypothetical protein
MPTGGPRRRTSRLAALLAVLATLGCSLAARNHACYPYLTHLAGGRVPRALLADLAREPRTRREVRGYRAPSGHYWRPRRVTTLDVRDVRTVVDDYELARCPAAPRPSAGRRGAR